MLMKQTCERVDFVQEPHLTRIFEKFQVTLFFIYLYKNLFYKNIETEILEILRIF